MAAGGLVALFRGCMESLKGILTSQEFGTECELLCAELSVQSLRFRLWGESVGLDVVTTSDDLNTSITDRHDIQPIFTQTINTIAYLLTDIEELRRKYQWKQALSIDETSEDDIKPSRACKSLRSVSSFGPVAVIRQRMRENQKHKSFLTITKWTVCDARRFDERVRRLKSLIDGLEDITKAAGIARLQTNGLTPVSTNEDENPPPYSLIQAFPSPPSARLGSLSLEPTPRTTPAAAIDLDFSISEYYSTLKRYLAAYPDDSNLSRPHAREKLISLSDQQFKELATDVFDDLQRRQQYEPETYDSLPHNPYFHPKRNEARRRLSTLLSLRFRHLVADTVFEFERRFLDVQSPGQSVQFSVPLVTRRPAAHRSRWRFNPPKLAPPLLQHRAAHRSTIISPPSASYAAQALEFASSEPEPPTPSAPRTSLPCGASLQMLKHFRCSMDDPTHKVIPAALKKYNINVPSEQYALHLVHGATDRCLGMNEKPLMLFKQLDKEGLKPMFILRKISSRSQIGNGDGAGHGEGSTMTTVSVI